MGRPDGLFKTREKASLKLGRPDGHDGRPNGLRTGCEQDSERSFRDLVLESLIASRPNGYEFRPNAWLFSFHFAHEH
jgi:hypothetical protein